MLLNQRIPYSYILNKVRNDLIYVLVFTLVVLFFTNRYAEVLPNLPLTIPVFIGTAISILLSFKLNQSYDRWWEARKIWGAIVNDSRSLVIQLQTLPADGNESVVRRIALRQIAWSYSLGQSLRGLNPVDNLSDLLHPGELEALNAHNNKPLALLQMHAVDIKRMRAAQQLDHFTHIQLDNTLVRLCDAQGKAERIKSTVFPVTYRLFLHGIIYLFIVTLSISLQDVPWYYEIPLLMLLSAAFLLLEKSATHMQDPFENKPTDTAMTAIARNIEINIRQLLGDRVVPAPHPPDGFYLT